MVGVILRSAMMWLGVADAAGTDGWNTDDGWSTDDGWNTEADSVTCGLEVDAPWRSRNWGDDEAMVSTETIGLFEVYVASCVRTMIVI